MGSILQFCGLNKKVLNWSGELEWAIKKLKGKALISIVLRLAWRAIIYYIWRERNRRMHDNTAEDPNQIVEHVKSVVRIRLISLKNISNDPVNCIICHNCGLCFE